MKTIRRRLTHSILVILLSLLVLALVRPTASRATPGHLDGTFGNGGKVITTIGIAASGNDDEGRGVAVQADGKIVVAGWSHNGSRNTFVVTRYNANGTLDTTFNGTGKVITDFPGSAGSLGYGVALQSDGKIVVAGRVDSIGGTTYSFGVARYHGNIATGTPGTLDTAFNGTGMVTTNVFNNYSIAYNVAVAGNGKIVVGGYAGSSNNVFALAQYNSNGSLDTAFNGTGKLTTDFSGANRQNVCNSVTVQSDRKIVAAGWVNSGTQNTFAVARYHGDISTGTPGTLDTTFNVTGKATTAIGGGDETGNSVAVQADGKIVVAGRGTKASGLTGYYYSNIAVVRYTPAGALDTSFNTTGTVMTAFNLLSEGNSVALQGDGKIVVAGTGSGALAVVRYHGNISTGTPGTLDVSFDGSGIGFALFNDTASGSAKGASVALQPDGKIVAATSVDGTSGTAIGLARFQVKSVARDFDGDGNADLLFQNNVGQIAAWYMNGAGVASSTAYLSTTSLGDWKVKGLADMNGDGNSDIIFQNDVGQIVVWYMDGAGAKTSSGYLSTNALGDWRVVSVADMNNDGNADVIFQNNVGQVVVWYRNGSGAVTSVVYLTTVALGDWRVVGVADMNNDGNADLIFQNTIGLIFAWYMDGTGTRTSSGYLSISGLGDWRVVGVADMNNDGNADLIFQNTLGQIVAWYMNGAGTKTSSAYLTTSALGDWRVR